MTSVNKGKRNLQRAADHELVMAAIHPAPKPVRERKHKAKVMPRRKQLAQQIEDIVRLIVFWRDGSECIEKELDGVRCGGCLQWGHYIPRQQSRWLKYDLGNSFPQCRNHNNLHDKGAQTMGVWFGATFGTPAALAMEAERDAHRNKPQKTIPELEEMLTHYDDLYQRRYFVDTDIPSRIAAGYYGDVIKNTWIKEGRL